MYRNFILAGCIILALFQSSLSAQRLSRDYNTGLITSQLGFLPSSPKFCAIAGNGPAEFEVVVVTSGQVAFKGKLLSQPGDFGHYMVGDFTALNTEGRFYLRADTFRSYPFSISKTIYQAPMNMIVGYFATQRCGASSTGYLSPCHLDDGIRVDNGKHQDVTGGWHDASDLRKWVSATIYGLLGLARAYELRRGDRTSLLSELRWGNEYFLKMQEPEGYVMDFIGGDLEKHSDNNRWTNNRVEPGNNTIRLLAPNAGNSKQLMLVSGNSDDRIIQTAPVDLAAQYSFIAAEAMMARITAKSDPAYAKRCLNAAEKCYKWCRQKNSDTTAQDAGAALQASIELYKTTGSAVYADRAPYLARFLAGLQVAGPEHEVQGYFKISPALSEPYKNISRGCQAFISLSELVTLMPMDADNALWKSMVRNYAEKYLLQFASRNSFGIVPYGLFESKDPGGNRKIGPYWYRYFMQPELEWWVGINANLASAGIGLLRAGRLLRDEHMRAAAQRQLDWILGANPLNSSTMLGTGYNHPAHFAGSSFLPNVPLIDGAVYNGLGGDQLDNPVKGNGMWQISEYWTPMVAYTLWLMAELSAASN